MKRTCFLILLCVFALSLNAQKLSIGVNLAPQVYTMDFKKPAQISPVHTLVWYQISEKFTVAGGYTVIADNIVTAGIYGDLYLVHLVNTAGNSNFLGLGYTFPVPKTQAALFLELGTLYERKMKIVLSAGVFIPFKIGIL